MELSRRSFLVGLGASALSMGLGCGLRKMRVVIVGGGLAGLACGAELKRAGVQVQVFEASERPGGRVRSIPYLLPGTTLDVGAEFVGMRHETWLHYARSFQLEVLNVEWPQRTSQVKFALGKRTMMPAEDHAFESLFEAIDELADGAGPPDEPWLWPGAETLDARSVGDWLRELPMEPRDLALARSLFENENGVSVDHQSLLAFIAQAAGDTSGDPEGMRCAGGSERLVRALAEELGEALVTRSPVQRIEYDPKVRVSLASGEQHEADLVVLTAAPSVWPKIEFVPALPARLEGLQMGRHLKAFARAPRRFWLDSGLSGDAFTDTPLGTTWEATTHAADDLRQTASSLTMLPGGPKAEEVLALDPNLRSDRLREELAQVFPEFADELAEIVVVDWTAEPWIGASYSFPAPGEVTRVGDVLTTGLGRLRFAGERTTYRYLATMEGALYSGTRLAKAICEEAGVEYAGPLPIA